MNFSTLPVPSQVQNDCANTGVVKTVSTAAGVAKAVSAAKVVRNFFMSLLLWLRLKILQPLAATHRRRLQNA